MTIKIFLDDVRDPCDVYHKDAMEPWNDQGWVIAKTVEEAIDIIQRNDVLAISFDHDLGTEKTGYDLARWIEEHVYLDMIPRFQWNIHSANPVGRENIKRALTSIERYWF